MSEHHYCSASRKGPSFTELCRTLVLFAVSSRHITWELGVVLLQITNSFSSLLAVLIIVICNSQSQMACLNTLKQEIKTLEAVFPKTHDRFQIVSASVDELNCKFVGSNGKKYEIHANITVSFIVKIHYLHGVCVKSKFRTFL